MDWQYLLLSFEGRIGRKSFWLTILLFVVAGIIASILDAILATPRIGGEAGSGIISLLLVLVLIYPALALYAKRWHDRGKSGWWSLIGLVPIIGGIWMLVELGFLKGTPGVNRYGADPLGQAATA